MYDSETDPVFEELFCYAKAFSGLLPEDEACLKSIAPLITPHLEAVTESFYMQMNNIPQAAIFLKGRIDVRRIQVISATLGKESKYCPVKSLNTSQGVL